jgi:hypothetical protein
MKTLMNLALLTCLVVLAAAKDADPQLPQHQALPDLPAAVDELVMARPYVLDQGYVHTWRADKPKVSTGYLLVLRANPVLVTPVQSAQPVLCVGNQTAERINVGDESGYVIALVPCVLDDPKDPNHLDLATSEIWFGNRELPERMTPRLIAAERRVAQAQGITSFAAEQLEAATERGGETLRVLDKMELLRRAADLIEQYSPQETDLIEQLRLPRPLAPKQ